MAKKFIQVTSTRDDDIRLLLVPTSNIVAYWWDNGQHGNPEVYCQFKKKVGKTKVGLLTNVEDCPVQEIVDEVAVAFHKRMAAKL